MRKELASAINLARRIINENFDAKLAIFVVRDFEELEEVDLKDLAWALYQNYGALSEVEWFLNELEERLGRLEKI